MNFLVLVNCLQDLFTKKYQTEIEEFISSKNPKTTADVEHLIQQFNYKSGWPHA